MVCRRFLIIREKKRHQKLPFSHRMGEGRDEGFAGETPALPGGQPKIDKKTATDGEIQIPAELVF